MNVPTSFALLATLLCAAWTPLSRGAVDSVITQWLTITQSTIATLGIEHQQGARLYSIVATAQYNAIIRARAYTKAVVPEGAAAAYASHAVLSHLFNWRQTAVYDVALVGSLAKFNVNDSLLPVLQELTVPYVQSILTTRLKDGASYFANFKPAANGTANWGRYQFTPGQTTARYPQVATAKGWWLSSSDVSKITAGFKRFNLSDPEYARQLEEVELYGSVNSTLRSDYGTGSARFWALGSGTGTVAGIWINISASVIPASTPLIHQARFFQLLTTSFWDAAISCWRVKYRELFWRPITAIRTYHGVGSADPTWTPFLSTPTHPEYPSGHQCSTGAAVYVLEAYLGTSQPISVSSAGAPDLGSRTYPSIRAVGDDASYGRLYAGVHFMKANVDGLALGYQVARFIHTKKFGSITFESSL